MSKFTERSLDVNQVFAEDGPLATTLSGYQPRAGQQQMAHTVEQALLAQQTVLIEAPTGIGKTFAYLIPSLISSQKVVISTATKTLQDQLFEKDLPFIAKTLGIKTSSALLKGRNNYLCQYHLELNLSDGRFMDKKTITDLADVQDWACFTESGDLNELEHLTESSEAWHLATSTADNCLGQECPHIAECFMHKARKKAMQSDVVVVNHHLLFADRSLKDEGFGELLPGTGAIILDEAHQIPEIASRFFGETFGSNQLLRLCHDIHSEWLANAKDMAALVDAIDKLELILKNTKIALDKFDGRGPWSTIEKDERVTRHLDSLLETLTELVDYLALAESRSKGLALCYTKAQEFLQGLEHFLDGQQVDVIRWYEVFSKSFILHQTPLHVSKPFQAVLKDDDCAWIFTSATLTVDNRFDFFKNELGFNDEVACSQLESPFNFAEQGMFYLPRHLPDCQDPAYTKSCVEAAIPVIEQLQGRTFFLFTSHRALREAALILSKKTTLNILVQGESSRGALLNNFRKQAKAVLLGTSSFWEGVDVRGEALSCVIIDKLPFASPGDPVNQARIDAYQRQQKMPFIHYQLPKAVIMLKQGAGRLIRDQLDKGVLMICDPRLVAKDYGQIFVKSLPAFKRSRDFQKIKQFIISELP